MSDELKPCPFCGKQLTFFGHDIDRWLPDDLPEEKVVEVYRHPNSTMEDQCALGGLIFKRRLWQSRPIEDALRAQLAAMTARAEKAEAVCMTLGNALLKEMDNCTIIPLKTTTAAITAWRIAEIPR
jgi:hypothetical protein